MTLERMMRRRLIALFFFGLVLFSYPILTLFNRDTLIFGFPLLYVYLYLVWVGLIASVAMVSRVHAGKGE
jgi:hypothetical protein